MRGEPGQCDFVDVEVAVRTSVPPIERFEDVANLIFVILLEVESTFATAGAVAALPGRTQGIAPIAGEGVVFTILRQHSNSPATKESCILIARNRIVRVKKSLHDIPAQAMPGCGAV